METFLLQFFVFLASAAIAVPIAKKCGLGSVLGYLIAGIVIGPFGVSLIHNVEEVMHFTEFGVVMMLFLVGLELKPSLLWELRLPILGIGGSQVILTGLAISAIGMAFIPWQPALAIGFILALSSTAIVLQTLQEKGQMNTEGGRSIFSVLLFQDLAVIPMLAGLPLLATFAIQGSEAHHSGLFDITSLPNYLRIGATIGAILLVLVLGKFACRPIFRAIAAAGVREIFVAAALGLVIGTSLLMLLVGLSPALGAFLAGVVLADSEYRHELESDIEPFKGLLLGIFFISIGASLNFRLIGNNLTLILGMAFGLIALKWLVLLIIGGSFKMSKDARSLFAIALAQGGEFAFVLFQFARSNGVLDQAMAEPLVSAVAISMFLAPLLFLAHEKLAVASDNEQATQEADNIDSHDHRVILAGFGRLGTDVGRFLISSGIKPVILDHDPGHVSLLRKLGYEVYYGDATRLDLMESAGAGNAELLIIAIGDVSKAKQIVEMAHKHYPHLKIIVNAEDRKAAFAMMDMGVEYIHRETFGSALSVGKEAMTLLGTDPYQAHRQSLIFSKQDQTMMPELLEKRHDKDSYVSLYQEHHQQLEELMQMDNEGPSCAVDKAWTAKNPEK